MLDNVVEHILLPDVDGKSLGEIDILVAFLLDLSVGHVRLHRGDPLEKKGLLYIQFPLGAYRTVVEDRVADECQSLFGHVYGQLPGGMPRGMDELEGVVAESNREVSRKYIAIFALAVRRCDAPSQLKGRLRCLLPAENLVRKIRFSAVIILSVFGVWQRSQARRRLFPAYSRFKKRLLPLIIPRMKQVFLRPRIGRRITPPIKPPKYPPRRSAP